MEKSTKIIYSILVCYFSSSRVSQTIRHYFHGNRELWHVICFFFLGLFLFSIDLMIFRNHSKKIIFVVAIIHYLLIMFSSLEWEAPLKVLSFFDWMDYSSSYNHLYHDFLGIALSIIFNFFLYSRTIKKKLQVNNTLFC